MFSIYGEVCHGEYGLLLQFQWSTEAVSHVTLYIQDVCYDEVYQPHAGQ